MTYFNNKKRIIILDTLNLFNFFYVMSWRFFQDAEVYSLRYQGERFEFLYKILRIRVIDIQGWDLVGFAIPEYFYQEFPELKIRINEKAYFFTEKHSQLFFQEKYPIIKRMISFARSKDIVIPLKRYLINEIRSKLKSLELASIIALYNKNSKIIYLPRNIQFSFLQRNEFYEHLNVKTPFWNKLLCHCYEYIINQVMCFVFSLYFLFTILKRGLCLKKHVIKKNLAMPVVWGFGKEKQLSDELFLDKEKLSFENVLFTQEGWLIDERTKRHFLDLKINPVNLNKIKPTLAYLFFRILNEYFLNFFLPCFSLNIFSKRSFIFSYMLRSVKNIVKYELFLENYDIKVYLTRDEYSVNSNIRSIVSNRKGVKTIGLPHGDNNHPFLNMVGTHSYIQLDEYFVWGKKYAQYFSLTNPDIKKFTPVGIPRVNFIKNSFHEKNEFISFLKSIREKHLICSVFTGFLGQDFLNRRPQRLCANIMFLDTILKTHKDKFNIYLIIKYKDNCSYESLHPQLKMIMNEFRENDSLVRIIGAENNSYNLIAYSDMFIAWGLTSAGLEAISTSKPAIYFDPYKSRYNILRSIFKEAIVAWDEEEFRQLISQLFSGKKLPDDIMYQQIRGDFCNIDGDFLNTDPTRLIRESIYQYL